MLSEPGDPLDKATLRDFRSSFGHGFSSVRVHTDERAAASAASLPARAYTIGHHVVFGRGEFAPGTTTGRHLLAHELAHVVQQKSERIGGVRRRRSQGGRRPRRRSGVARRAGQRRRQWRRWVRLQDGLRGVFRRPLQLANLQGAIEFGRPVDTIVDDINGLSAGERTQAINDIVQARADRSQKQAKLIAGKSAQTDPKLQTVYDPQLDQNQGVFSRIDLILRGLAGQKPMPGWNFTPSDFAKLQHPDRI